MGSGVPQCPALVGWGKRVHQRETHRKWGWSLGGVGEKGPSTQPCFIPPPSPENSDPGVTSGTPDGTGRVLWARGPPTPKLQSEWPGFLSRFCVCAQVTAPPSLWGCYGLSRSPKLHELEGWCLVSRRPGGVRLWPGNLFLCPWFCHCVLLHHSPESGGQAIMDPKF